jgi:hypothetical protein
MDDARFDTLARFMASRADRRVAAPALFGSVLGLLTFTGADAAKSGNCTPACPECQSCDKGTCKRKKGKKRCRPGTCVPVGNGTGCGGDPCKACQNGNCASKGNGDSCENNPCKTCQNGACASKENGTACNGAGKCHNGTCNQPPNCLSAGASCFGGNCCSGNCEVTCFKSALGFPCRTEADCAGNPLLVFCGSDFTCQMIDLIP